MSSPNSSIGVTHVINSFFGSAMQIPLGFLKPGGGYLDAYQGYFGSLASNGLDFASLNVGPGVTNPVSIFSKGLNEFVGMTVQKGAHHTIGTHLVTGTSFKSYAGINKIGNHLQVFGILKNHLIFYIPQKKDRDLDMYL